MSCPTTPTSTCLDLSLFAVISDALAVRTYHLASKRPVRPPQDRCDVMCIDVHVSQSYGPMDMHMRVSMMIMCL